MRRRALVLAASLSLLLGLAVLVYPGPARSFVRGTLGDLLVAAFLYLAAGAAVHARWRACRLAGVGALALGLELAQLGAATPDPGTRSLVALIVGTTFDPWDLLAAALGLLAAAAIEERVAPRASHL